MGRILRAGNENLEACWNITDVAMLAMIISDIFGGLTSKMNLKDKLG